MEAKCNVTGCAKPKKSLGLCVMHYNRQRRTGTTDDRKKSDGYIGGGYFFVFAPEHPLTRGRDGFIGEHRKVLYDHTDHTQPLVCHWCGGALTWDSCRADHVNEIKSDNRPENIVPSCNVCNLQRAKDRAVATYRERHAIRYTLNGVTRYADEWAADLGVCVNALAQRLKIGWSLERTLTTPIVRKNRPK